jgi:hypothetical protein
LFNRVEKQVRVKKENATLSSIQVNSQLVRVRCEPEDEINTVLPIVESNKRQMSVKVNVNVLERAAFSTPSISSEKDNSVFSSLDDDSTLIPLKSRHYRI